MKLTGSERESTKNEGWVVSFPGAVRPGRGMDSMGSRMTQLGLGVGLVSMALASAAQAQFSLNFSQRAQDGTVYQVISVENPTSFAGADAVKITAIAGAVGGTQSCAASGQSGGQPTSAISGVDSTAMQVLHPYAETLRTGVLTVVDYSTLEFRPIGSGRLTMGNGANRVEICREPNLCFGGLTDAQIYPLSSNLGGVPAACIAEDFSGGCAGSAKRTTLAFGLGSMGDPPVCTSPPTASTMTCSPAPSDGITLGAGQALVLIYNHSLGQQGFSIAAAGYGIDTDGTDSASCPDTNSVVSAGAFGNASPARPPVRGAEAPALSPLGFAISACLLSLAGAVLAGRRVKALAERRR